MAWYGICFQISWRLVTCLSLKVQSEPFVFFFLGGIKGNQLFQIVQGSSVALRKRAWASMFLVNGFWSRWDNSTLLEYIVDVDSERPAPADWSLVDAVIMFWLHFNKWRRLGDTESERQKGQVHTLWCYLSGFTANKCCAPGCDIKSATYTRNAQVEMWLKLLLYVLVPFLLVG